MNNAVLKEILNQKVAEQTVSVPSSITPGVSVQPVAVLPPMTVTLSLNFNLPLDGGQLPLEQIQALFQTISGHVDVAGSVRVTPAATTYATAPGRPVSAESPANPKQFISAPVTVRKSTSAVAKIPMSEKQRAMILALTARKKLSAEAVENILKHEFGHTDGAALAKSEASRLIDALMAK